MTLQIRPGFQWWDPSLITTALWLDSSDNTTIFSDAGTTQATNGGAVQQWNDKSGNGRNVTQATEANRPSYVTAALNGKNVVNWGATSNNKGLGITAALSPDRIYGVGDWDGGATFGTFQALFRFNGNPGPGVSVQGDTGTGWFGGTKLFLNGASASTAAALPAISSPFIFALDQPILASRISFDIGRDAATTDRGWQGSIAEIIVSQSELSLLNRQKIEGYLAHKWGLTANLPSDHPYKTNAPAP